MVNRQTRVKKKKFRRTPGGKTVIHYSRDKKTYAKDSVTGKRLIGTGNQTKNAVRKKGKTTRRPSVKFGGILGGQTRKALWENYSLVISGRKEIEEVPVKFKGMLKATLKGEAK